MERLIIDQDLPPVERSLGVVWYIQSDVYKFKFVVKDRKVMRKVILPKVGMHTGLGKARPH